MASSGMGNQVRSSFGSGAEGFHLLGYAAGYVAFVALVVPPSLVYRAAEAASRVMSSYRAR
jgi:hypothetical protein